MVLRSDGRQLSFHILAIAHLHHIMSAPALPTFHSDPAAASSPSRKRKKKKSRKAKSPSISQSDTINGDVKYGCTLSTVTEVASLLRDLDSEMQEVTPPSVYSALRQRNVGNGVNGGSAEVIRDNSGVSKKDDISKEEIADNWTDCGKENGQQGPVLNDRKLERDGT